MFSEVETELPYKILSLEKLHKPTNLGHIRYKNKFWGFQALFYGFSLKKKTYSTDKNDSLYF